MLAFAAWAAPASASVGPCLPGGGPNGPLCTFWTGKVTFVADGDTIDVDIAGDGRRRSRRVRLTGFNAMELTTYSHTASKRRGDCHGVEATNRLEQLLRGGAGACGSPPRIRAASPAAACAARSPRGSAASGSTSAATCSPRATRCGCRTGSSGPGTATTRTSAARRPPPAGGCGTRTAAATGRRPDAALTLDVNYDAKYNDRFNVNGEWAEIHNDSGQDVSLERWWFRDSALRRYTFQKGAVVPAGGSVRLRMGYGADTADELHWGLDSPPFENPSYDARATGDGGYLFDPRGNLRAWVIYN